MDAEYKKLIEWSKVVMPERIIDLQPLFADTKNEVANIRKQVEKKLSTVNIKDFLQLGKYYAILKMLLQFEKELTEAENLLNEQVLLINKSGCHVDDLKYDITEEEKIGKYARRRFKLYFEKVKNPPLENFMDKEWCHTNLGICYPLLKEIDIKCPVNKQTGYLGGKHNRFWAEPVVEIHGKYYLICSQWFRQFRTKLDDWFDSNEPN